MRRKPSLEEWFLAYQMRAVTRSHAHMPLSIDADVTPLVERAQARGSKVSFPAIGIKALALTAREHPAINRMYASTVTGDRIVEFEHVSVNMPVMLRDGGFRHLFGMVVRDADEKSVPVIRDEIRAAQETPLEDTRLTRYVAQKPNNLVWRSILRGVHFASYNLRGLEKLGGGLSVSSLINHRQDKNSSRSVSYGPTCVTLLLCGLRRDGGRHVLEMGLGVDHCAIGGLTARKATDHLHDVLSSSSEEALAWFD